MVEDDIVTLEADLPLWDRFFTVAPLVVIGTREGEGYDLAPKHMVTPMGWDNYFGFICTPKHSTYHNAKEHETFTVTYPRPEATVVTSLTASPRCHESGAKAVLEQLDTFPAEAIDGVFLKNGYLFLECRLDRIVDGFSLNSLLVGKIVAAHVRREALRTSEGDDQQLLHDAPLLAYLNPGRFATVQASNAFPFPANFKK